MGLRCSLLGHDYGESEIEREREEQGNEVVVTVREFEKCQRCGAESIISENKEVTTIEEPEPTPEPMESKTEEGLAGSASAEPTPAEQGSVEPMTTGPESETEIIDETVESDPEPVGFNDDDFHPPESADEDDGVILDDEDDEVEEQGRGHGEWPDPEDTNVNESARGSTDWPDTGLDDEGFDAQVDDGSDVEVSFGGGLTPESAPHAEDDAEFVEADSSEETGFVRTTRPEPQRETGFTRAREAPKPDQASESSPSAELICPECGQFGGAASGSSLRAGDICPECRKGYLSEHE